MSSTHRRHARTRAPPVCVLLDERPVAALLVHTKPLKTDPSCPRPSPYPPIQPGITLEDKQREGLQRGQVDLSAGGEPPYPPSLERILRLHTICYHTVSTVAATGISPVAPTGEGGHWQGCFTRSSSWRPPSWRPHSYLDFHRATPEVTSPHTSGKPGTS